VAWTSIRHGPSSHPAPLVLQPGWQANPLLADDLLHCVTFCVQAESQPRRLEREKQLPVGGARELTGYLWAVLHTAAAATRV
jgi:hypothetical protein